MMKARAVKDDGGHVYIMGLSDRNLELLRKGVPIVFDGREMGIQGEVLIMWGRDEEQLGRMLTPELVEAAVLLQRKRGGGPVGKG